MSYPQQIGRISQAVQQGNLLPSQVNTVAPGAMSPNFGDFLRGGPRPPQPAPQAMGRQPAVVPGAQQLIPPTPPMGLHQGPAPMPAPNPYAGGMQGPGPMQPPGMGQPGPMMPPAGLPGQLPPMGMPGMPGMPMPGQMPPPPMGAPGMGGPGLQQGAPQPPGGASPNPGPQAPLRGRPTYGAIMSLLARAKASGDPAQQYNVGRMLGETLRQRG